MSTATQRKRSKNQELQARLEFMFTDLNASHFGGRVLPCHIKVTSAKRHMTGCRGKHCSDPEGDIIMIRPDQSAADLRRTLLHEMAHAVASQEEFAEFRKLSQREKMDALWHRRQVTRDEAPAYVHGPRWQREMLRLALDHDETWAVIDVFQHNESVGEEIVSLLADNPAEYEFIRNVHGEEGICRLALARHGQQFRQKYLEVALAK